MNRSRLDSMTMAQYLGQSEYWLSAEGRYVPLSEMSDEHRELSARWLYGNSTAIILLVEGEIHEGIASGDGTAKLPDVMRMVAQNPKKWIQEQPLFKALVRDLPAVDVSVWQRMVSRAA